MKKKPAVRIDVTELTRNFRAAKDKRLQIDIEADLHCCSPRLIAEELYKAGALVDTGIMPWQFSDEYVPIPPAKPHTNGPKQTFDEQRAQALFDEGVSYANMAKLLGVNDSAIKKWAARRGLKREKRTRGWKAKEDDMTQDSDEKFEEIIESVDAGKRGERCDPCEPTQPECGDCAKDAESAEPDAWQGYTVPQPLRERDVMTVGDFVQAFASYLTEAIADAPLSINGAPLRHALEFNIRVRNEQVFVDLTTVGGF